MKKYKVFLAAQEIAGLMGRIKKELDEEGIKNEYICLWKYKYANEKDSTYENNKLKRYFKYVSFAQGTNKIWKKRFWQILECICLLRIFFLALFKYNIFIYIYCHGIFDGNYYLKRHKEVEFKILKFLKKNIIMWCVGSDSRAPYCDGFKWFLEDKDLFMNTNQLFNNIRMLEKYATMIDMTASAVTHSKKFIHYTAIGNPVPVMELPEKKATDIIPTIAHAPSDPKAKGSNEIRGIIDNLRRSGLEFNYVEFTGLPHEVLIKKLKKVDIVVDQLYSDYPLSLMATDAYSLGIPAVVGGFFSDYYKKYFPCPLPPTIYVHPQKVEEILKKLIIDEKFRISIGRIGRDFLIRNWQPKMIVKKLLCIAEGDVDSKWFCEPNEIKYIWGAGCKKDVIVRRVKYMMANHGEDSLRIENNEVLELYKEISVDYNK